MSSLYEAAIPVFIAGFRNMSAFLERGRAFADEHGIAHGDLLDARLIEDMAPLRAQVQRASDTAKGTAVRVGGLTNMVMPDDEIGFDDLQARIAATVAVLERVSPDAINAREAADIVLPLKAGPVTFTGASYIQSFAVPNFFFHVTTAYAILRHKHVPLGKKDFLGWS